MLESKTSAQANIYSGIVADGGWHQIPKKFFGWVTVSDKGQVAIPKIVRKILNINKGGDTKWMF